MLSLLYKFDVTIMLSLLYKLMLSLFYNTMSSYVMITSSDRDSRHWLPDIKFSPDGKSFATASMDHKIYIYNRDSYRLKGTCDRHNSFIKGFDYSEDSMYIQSDSGDNEHLYFEAEDGEYFASGSQLKDIRWSGWTCLFGWPVQGAWPHFSDVESGLECEPTAVNRSPDRKLLAVGNQKGEVRLLNYPAIVKRVSTFPYLFLALFI